MQKTETLQKMKSTNVMCNIVIAKRKRERGSTKLISPCACCFFEFEKWCAVRASVGGMG